ncbi:MAG TPA: hypothetical protein VF551_05955 [Chthoniobacterales bacterium]
MSFANWREKMKEYDKNAAVIFDAEEPIGAATDLTLPPRRWFRRKNTRTREGLPAARAEVKP